MVWRTVMPRRPNPCITAATSAGGVRANSASDAVLSLTAMLR